VAAVAHIRCIGASGLFRLVFALQSDGSVEYSGNILGWDTETGSFTEEKPLRIEASTLLLDYVVKAEILETGPVVVMASAWCKAPVLDAASYGPSIFVLADDDADAEDDGRLDARGCL
jgi:hypothetical protein